MLFDYFAILLEMIKRSLNYYRYWILPINQTKVVFSNFRGKPYGNQGGRIINQLLQMKKGLDIVWLTYDMESFVPKGVRKVRYDSLQAFKELATAKVWIDNQRKEWGTKKRKAQYYIQTWHGSSIPLKCIERDAAKELGRKYVWAAKRDSKMMNVLVAGCKLQKKIMEDAFWYKKGEFLHSDLDVYRFGDFLSEKMKDDIVSSFKIKKGSRIVLYAPTFRDNNNDYMLKLDYERLIKNLSQRFGGNWSVVIRLHPNHHSIDISSVLSNNVFNGSAYPSGADLLLASDLLLTDYSSIMFEGLKYNKRVMLFAPDIDLYLKRERAMYFNIKKELPMPLAENNDELENIILHCNWEVICQKCQRFIEGIGYYKEGPEVVAQRVIDVVGEFES